MNRRPTRRTPRRTNLPAPRAIRSGFEYLEAWSAAVPLLRRRPDDDGPPQFPFLAEPDPGVLDVIDAFERAHPDHPLVVLSRHPDYDEVDLLLLYVLVRDRVHHEDRTVGISVRDALQETGLEPEGALLHTAHEHLLAADAPLVRAGLVTIDAESGVRGMGRRCAATDSLLRSVLPEGASLDLLVGRDSTICSWQGALGAADPGEDLPPPLEPHPGPLLLAKATQSRFDRFLRIVEGRRRAHARRSGRHRRPGARGVAAVFWGPSGTGKTEAARHVAARLGMPLLYRTCASLMDKYVGSSERNVAAAFAQAASCGTEGREAVLLFDEADSLVMDRAEASHSVYRQVTTTFLTEIERFDGVCLFTTNHADAIDGALGRRTRVQIRFGRPPRAVRRAIWTAHLEATEMHVDEDVDLERLAALPLTGGEIKNVVENARDEAYADDAATLTHADLERSIASTLAERGIGDLERTPVGFSTRASA